MNEQTEDRRCGTCGYKEERRDNVNHYTFNCVAPIPKSVFNNRRLSMLSGEGHDCKCWKKKEAKE